MRLLLVLLTLSVLIAACDSTAPPPVPQVNVVITAVENADALNDAVAQALTGTAQVNIGATETVLAQGGITLTPSPTPTQTPTVPARPTRETTPTWTFTPTITPTPTFAPYLTNTPVSVSADTPGWLRVAHAWVGSGLAPASAFDVYINGNAVSRALTTGEATNFQQIAPGVAQVSLRAVDANQPLPADDTLPPTLSQTVQVVPGENMTVVIADGPTGAHLVTVTENAAPLPSGVARLTMLQANPQLFPANVVMPDIQRALVHDLKPNQIVGPLDITSGSSYLIDLYDSANPSVFLGSLPLVSFASRVSYLAVFVPTTGEEATGMIVFSSSTRALPGEVHARFINVAENLSTLTVMLDNLEQFSPLPIGISDAVPLSPLGSQLDLLDQDGRNVAETALGPWQTPEEQNTDKLVLIFDNPADALAPAGVTVYSQNAPRSAINGSIRLVHALPGVIPLNLEIRPVRSLPAAVSDVPVDVPAQAPEEQSAFVKVAEASFGNVSEYASRVPEVYNVRVVLSGTRNVIAEIRNVQLMAGGVYDFVALPGPEPGSAVLELVQPRAQVAPDRGNPETISEAVAATLTAVSPISTATPTRVSSPTATRTPLPTNTPRPSNTPEFPPPAVMVDPAPPRTVQGSVMLYGQYFPPGRVYSVYLDNAFDTVQTGIINNDGTIVSVVNLPDTLSPGFHTLRVCAAGSCPGSGAEAFAIINVASPNLTPTATRQP